jgi:hypothetical protein
MSSEQWSTVTLEIPYLLQNLPTCLRKRCLLAQGSACHGSNWLRHVTQAARKRDEVRFDFQLRLKPNRLLSYLRLDSPLEPYFTLQMTRISGIGVELRLTVSVLQGAEGDAAFLPGQDVHMQ